MCLSTAYFNKKSDDSIIARYVSEVKVNGNAITLTDVIGIDTTVRGMLSFVDLTGGTLIIDPEEACTTK